MRIELVQNLPAEKFPSDLHINIMKKVAAFKLGKSFIFYSVSLLTNFIILVWCLNCVFVESELLKALRITAKDFEFSFSFLWKIIIFINSYVSALAIVSLVFSILIMCYLLCLIVKTKIKFKNYISHFETNASSSAY